MLALFSMLDKSGERYKAHRENYCPDAETVVTCALMN